MELILLYWFFSTMYFYAAKCYIDNKITFLGFITTVFIGWIMLPLMLGAKIGEEIEKK